VPRHHRRPGKQLHADYGRITAYRSAAGFGMRLDGGTAYSGAVITPFYDSLLVKVTAWAPDPERPSPAWTAPARIPHPRRRDQPAVPRETSSRIRCSVGECTTRFIDDTPELFRSQAPRPRDSAAAFLGETIVAVNGNPEMKGRRSRRSCRCCRSLKPRCDLTQAPPPGTRDR
jgi:pyruvate carboxylase